MFSNPLNKGNHLRCWQQVIIGRAFFIQQTCGKLGIGFLPPPLIDDAYRRETEYTMKNDFHNVQRENMKTLAVTERIHERLSSRARHALFFSRLGVQMVFDVSGDVYCFGVLSTVPMLHHHQVIDLFMHPKYSLNIEKYKLGIKCEFLTRSVVTHIDISMKNVKVKLGVVHST